MEMLKSRSSRKHFLVKAGNVSVRIYPVRGKDYDYFQVADSSSGKRKLISFGNEKDARDQAAEIARQMSNGQLDVLSLCDIARTPAASKRLADRAGVQWKANIGGHAQHREGEAGWVSRKALHGCRPDTTTIGFISTF